MEGLLFNTHTLLGTIATLAILCLFVSARKGEEVDSNGNFVFQLIAAIGSDVDQNLKNLASSYKSKAADKKAEVYKRCGINKIDASTSIESYLFSLCSRNQGMMQKLSLLYKKIDTIGRKILDYSEIGLRHDEKELRFITHYNGRQEPRIIALMVFICSMLFLLLDSFSISNDVLVPFSWFFILNIVSFSWIVWANHFMHSYEDVIICKDRMLIVDIVCGIVCVFLPSFVFSLFLYLPFDILSEVFAILSHVTILSVACIPMYNRYWKGHEYSRTIVLKHMLYFLLSAVIGTGTMLFFETNYPHSELYLHIQFFRNPLYVRWLLLVVLLLDLIFIPVYGGYLHMKIDEWRAIRYTKREVAQLEVQLNEATEELYHVVKEVLSNNQSGKDV